MCWHLVVFDMFWCCCNVNLMYVLVAKVRDSFWSNIVLWKISLLLIPETRIQYTRKYCENVIEKVLKCTVVHVPLETDDTFHHMISRYWYHLRMLDVGWVLRRPGILVVTPQKLNGGRADNVKWKPAKIVFIFSSRGCVSGGDGAEQRTVESKLAPKTKHRLLMRPVICSAMNPGGRSEIGPHQVRGEMEKFIRMWWTVKCKNWSGDASPRFSN